MLDRKGTLVAGQRTKEGRRGSLSEGGGTRCLARQKREAGIVRQAKGRERWTVRIKKQGWTASLRKGRGRNSEA